MLPFYGRFPIIGGFSFYLGFLGNRNEYVNINNLLCVMKSTYSFIKKRLKSFLNSIVWLEIF